MNSWKAAVLNIFDFSTRMAGWRLVAPWFIENLGELVDLCIPKRRVVL
ncbi:hypothetical protein OAH36_01940 [Verrucomicrobia bacterium]|nr:hypothetical protein [Verrucomicrobiota bacterium]MDB4798342.1 hypothetical protein [Verrucomicrobiota bacterium]